MERTSETVLEVTQGQKLLLQLLSDGAQVRENNVDGSRWLRLSPGGPISLREADWDSLVARGWADKATGTLTDQGRRILSRGVVS